ncbi:MAG: hypothetical protein AAGD13_22825, partial [Pseudomonadota bacterium]
MAQTSSVLSFRTIQDQNLWAPGAAIELGVDTGDLLIFDPEEITYDIDIGGSFLGFEGELFFDTRFGLLAYAGIGEAGRFNGGIDIALTAEHDAIVGGGDTTIDFDFSDYEVTNAVLTSQGFGLGVEAGLDLVIGAQLGFRDIEFAVFGKSGDADDFSIIDIEEKRIPILSIDPLTTGIGFDLGFGLNLDLNIPTGADTEGRSSGQLQVDANGISDTPIIELSADVDELLLTLLGKIPFPPLAAVVKTLENSVFATFEFDISDYVPAIGEDIFTVEATVVDIGASFGAALSEDLTLDFSDGDAASPEADINIALTTDNGTPLDTSDDTTVFQKLGDTDVELPAPLYAGDALVRVDAVFDVNRAKFSHSFGIDATGSFTIDILQASTGGWLGEKLGINIGPLASFEFPEGGFRANLVDNLFPNSFDVPGNQFNSETETYEVYYSQFLPEGIDTSQAGQVQELIAFNEARQINAAASAAAFADVTDGRPSAVVDVVLGVFNNAPGPEAALWRFETEIMNADLETNLPVDDRDVVGIDALNLTGVTPGFLLAGYEVDGDSRTGETFFLDAGSATSLVNSSTISNALVFLDLLPTQDQITDADIGGIADGTLLRYRLQNGTNTINGVSTGRDIRVDGSVNIEGGDSDDLLVYFGNEGRYFNGNGQNGAIADVDDVFLANFAVSHPLDAIEWDLRPTAVGQSGEAIKLKLTRGDASDAVKTLAGADFETLQSFDVSGSGAVSDLILPGFIDSGDLFLDPGTYTLRIKVRDQAAGSGEFSVTVNRNFPANDLDLGTFATNSDEESDASGIREIVIRDVEITSVLDSIRIDSLGDATEQIDIRSITLHEQHEVNILNVESFVLKTSDQDDNIATSLGKDLIVFQDGNDTLRLTADRFAEIMDLGAGSDVALIEIGDGTQLGSVTLAADQMDMVFGRTGGDEAIFRNVSDTGARWSSIGPDPATGAPTPVFMIPDIGADANAVDLFNALNALKQMRSLPDFGTADTAPDQTPSTYIEVHTPASLSFNLGAQVVDFEAVSFQGSDLANDLALYFGGAVYEGGDSDGDTFAANFSDYVKPVGEELGILLNGFHDGGDPTASSPFPDGPGFFRYESNIVFENGETIRSSTIDGFERFFVTATPFNDILIGGVFDDNFFAGGGDDLLAAGGAPGTSAPVGTDFLSGGAGDDVFHANGDERVEINGGDDTDLLIYGPGTVETISGANVVGLRHDVETAGGTTTYAATDSATALLQALADRPASFSRTLSFEDALGLTTVVRDVEHSNLTGLDATDDLLIYDGGASYIGGERAGDQDTFVADFSAQTFGLTFIHDEAVNGTRLGNGTFVSGIDRLVVKLGSAADLVTGGAFDDYIEGGDGGDILRGGGSVVADTLLGQGGADLFAWNANDGVAIVDGGADSGEFVDRLVISAVGPDGSGLSAPGDGLGIRMFDAGGLAADLDANSSDADLRGGVGFTLGQSIRFEINAGSNHVDFVNIDATEVQGSNEEDDLIVFQGGTFYDGGERLGDRDIFGADLSGETRDLTFIARSGDDRIDDDERFSDIGNGTTIGNFERLYLDLGQGDDFALGGDFTDNIDGFGGADILAGGLGNDTIDGGAGEDILFYQGGKDLIRGGDDRDVLELGAIDGGYKSIAGGLSPTEINSVVEIASLGSALKVQDLVGDLIDSFDTVTFPFIRMQGQGGVSLQTGEFLGTDSASFFNTDVEIVVVSADDDDDILISGVEAGTLSGDGGDDVLISRQGDDVLIGGDGADRYVFKDNWGFDIIGGEIAGPGEIFFIGHDRADLQFLTAALDSGPLNDLQVFDPLTGATLVFSNYFAPAANGLNYTFHFDDQSTALDLTGLGAAVTGAIPAGLTIFGTDLRDDITQSTTGADSYFARAGNDLIVSSDGPDIISGGLGLDSISYADSPVSGPGDLGVVIDLSFGFGQSGHADGDILISVEDVLGSAGQDVLFGDGKRNALAGGVGNDDIDGQGGDDFLSGDAGDDLVAGGDGDDLVFGGGGNDTLAGDADDDFISAGAGSDLIYAGSGNDTVNGGDGNDTVTLEEGDDIYLIASVDPELGGGSVGNDSVDGGIGNDLIELSGFDAGATIDLGLQRVISGATVLAQLASFENAIGSDSDDTLIGDGAANSLAGNSGDDLLIGNDGADVLIGGSGFDRVDYAAETGGGEIRVDLAAGTGEDSFGNIDTLSEIEHVFGGNSYAVPGQAFDDLFGDDGDNRFTGNAGLDIDQIDGRNGTDTVDYGSEVGTQGYLADGVTPDATGVGVVVDLSATGSFASPNATDTNGHGDLLISIENVIGSIRDDSLTGDAGANSFVGGDGNDTIDGGDGIDIVDYSQEAGGLNLAVFINDLDPTTNLDTFGDADVLTSIEVIIGTDFSDTILRDASQQHTLFGEGGNDSIQLVGAFSGIDGNSLFGGDGDDLLVGLGGSDIFFGGTGDDEAIGNSGNDVYVYIDGLDTFTGLAGTANGSDEANFDQFGSAVIADLTTPQIFTSDTDDAGDGAVRQIMEVTGLDAVTATDSNDSLTGNADDNRLYGGAGNDTFTGGDGSDVIEGGDGVDTWIIADGGFGATVDLSVAGLNASDGFGNAESVGSVERIIGTAQDDRFTGSASDETFVGGAGVDSYIGGDGIDTIDLSAEGGSGSAEFNISFDATTGETFGTLIDTFGNIENFRGIERFIGSDGSFDDFFGGAGDEIFTGLAGSSTDRFEGAAGNDTVDYSLEDGASGVVADISINGSLGTPNATDSFGDGDALIDIENLIGSKNNDVFTGSAAANTLSGGLGDDVFFGNAGADAIYGGDGLDAVNYALETGGGPILVDLRRAGNHAQDSFGDFDTLISIEQVTGTSFGDAITGDDEANTLFGTHGNDFLDGWAGGDVLYGETDDDTLLGWEGDDSLFGGIGNDLLEGEQEDDFLDGGAGADVLYGGDGVDTASYLASAFGVDVSLLTGTGAGGDAAGDQLSKIENLIGSLDNDTLVGDGADNTLEGLAAADDLDGGLGIDTASYRSSSAGVIVSLASGTGSGGDADGD